MTPEGNLRAIVAALTTERDQLREALRPFAAKGDVATIGAKYTLVEVAHCVAAKSALALPEGSGDRARRRKLDKCDEWDFKRASAPPTTPRSEGGEEQDETMTERLKCHMIEREDNPYAHGWNDALRIVGEGLQSHPLPAAAPSPPHDWIERCAAIADSYAGKPVESPRDFEAWARHGERMSALRIANKIRTLLPTPPKESEAR